MPSPIDLTTLVDVRAWLKIEQPNQPADIILGPLITAASRMVIGSLSRNSIMSRQFSRRLDGLGYKHSRIMLPDWPVTSVSSLSIDGVNVAATTSPQNSGYLLDPWDGVPPGRPQSIDVFGYGFSAGRQNIAVTYVAGYLVAAEPQTIPGSPYQLKANGVNGSLAQIYGAFAADGGVMFAGGTALTLVASAPATGQYAVAADPTGVTTYTFAAADTGKAILVSYSFIPADLAQVCKELVGERYTYRDHVGQSSKSLAGQETVSYSQADMPAPLKLMLQPYKNTVPL